MWVGELLSTNDGPAGADPADIERLIVDPIEDAINELDDIKRMDSRSLDGVGIIVGIDRFMSEARAITNFSGNAIATLVVGKWTKTIDMDRVHNVLDGKIPFDYATLQDDDDEVTLGKVPHPSDVQNDLPATPYPILPEQKH